MSAAICSSRPARGAWVEIFSTLLFHASGSCRAPQGARGLKSASGCTRGAAAGRAPQGARGLKFFKVRHGNIAKRSRPARGAWVEIPCRAAASPRCSSRAPQGARGLKFKAMIVQTLIELRSRPARGAWVEITYLEQIAKSEKGRAPQGARGLKYRPLHHVQQHLRSRPARGAWVETLPDSHCRIPP